jgi:ribonucleoside-diphosphate reductase alpha chain
MSARSTSAPARDQLKPFEPALQPGQIEISENGRQVLEKRYLRRGPDGQPIETISEMFERVARTVAAPDGAYGYDVESTAATFYALLTSLRFFPNSPTFTGAGTPLGQLAACFVLPITDDLGKESEGIFETLRNAALIQQTGGGNGFSFSRLRPRGDMVAKSAGVASGPVGFLRVYDTAFGEVAQGGTRRGANMAVLRVDHPDIEEFIGSKAREGHIANFNISVGVTDDFMRAVADDGQFSLVNPRDGVVRSAVNARELFDKLATFAHHNGEPGVLFLDAANRANPVPHLYQLEATNPCGEQWLGPYENCCLGSINLAQHVTPGGKVDWRKLEESIVIATRFLDNVVDANGYVPAVPQLRQAAMQARRIGLGFMGLGDLMYRTQVRYGSEDAQELAAQVMEFIRFHAMKTSIELARERGPFLAIPGSIYDPARIDVGGSHAQGWQPPRPLRPYRRDWGRPALDWNEIARGIGKVGIRNAAQTTVAPTGTIGTVAGCEGYGCEPVFALAYTRTVKDNGRDLRLTYASPLFEAALAEAGLPEAQRAAIIEIVSATGSCQDVAAVPESIRQVFVVSQDITAEEHVYMQAAIQAFVDNSISKTCNFPPEATVEDVKKAYQLAWKLGCKGLTVYVTGSRREVVLATRSVAAGSAPAAGTPAGVAQAEQAGVADRAGEGQPAEAARRPTAGQATAGDHGSAAAAGATADTGQAPGAGKKSAWSSSPLPGVKRPRPGVLAGRTYRKETPLGTAFVTVNVNGHEQPFEVFLNVGKAGSDVAAVAEAVGRLISLVLRLPSSLDPNERLKQVIDQLAGIGGGRPLGFGMRRVRSLPDAVAQVLREHLNGYYEAEGAEPDEASAEQLPLPINERPIGDLCPECGQATFISIEGCKKCYACGYSEC